MELFSSKDIRYWRTQHEELQRSAREMYTGNQSQELIRGVDILRKIRGIKVDFFVVSAGFGLLYEQDRIPPYDCSFSGMKKSEILARSEALRIPHDFTNLCRETYDMMYLALGRDYLRALGNDWWTHSNQKTICFSQISTHENIIVLPAHAQIVKSFSNSGFKIHGVTGFKGDLLRILGDYAINQETPFEKVKLWPNSDYLGKLFCKLGNIDRFEVSN